MAGYKLLILVESLHMLMYCVHPFYKFNYNNTLFNNLQLLLTYIQFFGLSLNQPADMQLIFMYISFVVTLVMSLGLFYLIFTLKGRKLEINSRTTTILKFLGLFSILLNTVLAIPFYSAFENIIYCAAGSPLNGNAVCY